MHLLYITREYEPSSRLGGIATYVKETAEFLVSKGHKVSVIAACDDVFSSSVEESNGVLVYRLPGADYFLVKNNKILDKVISKFRSIFCYFSYRLSVKNKIIEINKSEPVDLIEFPEYGAEGLLYIAQRKHCIPFVIRIHGGTFFDNSTGKRISLISNPWRYFFGWSEIFCLRKTKYISAPSAAILEKTISILKIENGHKKVIPNYVNTKIWAIKNPAPLFSTNEFNIFSAGTIVETKGFGDLYMACKLLRSLGVPVKLEIAGKISSFGYELMNKATLNGDGSWFSLIGHIKREDLNIKYHRADLVVFPSWWEPFGIVCVEAMASGALVLASGNAGFGEIIKEGVDGFLFEPKNIYELKNKIKSVIDLSSNEISIIRKAAFEKSNAAFSIEKNSNLLLSFYKDICNTELKGEMQCGVG